MKLYKHEKSSNWWYEFSIANKRYRRSTKRPLNDKKGAYRVMMNDYNELMNKVQLGEKPEITLGEAFDEVLETLNTENTFKGYRSVKASAVKFWGAEIKLSKIDQSQIEEYANHLRKEGKTNNTVRQRVSVVVRVIRSASKKYNTQRDLSVPTIKIFRKSRFLSEEEERLVLNSLLSKGGVSSLKAHDLCIFLIDTGVRLNEAIDLEWSDIDMARREITVYRRKTGSITVLPMTDRVYELLERKSDQERPFESMSHAQRTLRAVIHEHCNQNEKIVRTRGSATIHSLRDTFATRMLKAGMALPELAILMGHSHHAMTLKYTHLARGDVVAKAREIMGA